MTARINTSPRLTRLPTRQIATVVSSYETSDLAKSGLTPDIVAQLNFPEFITIAVRRRSHGSGLLTWQDLPDAPLTMDQARALHDAGYLVLASRHFPDRVECRIKSSRNAPNAWRVKAIRPMSVPPAWHRDVRV